MNAKPSNLANGAYPGIPAEPVAVPTAPEQEVLSLPKTALRAPIRFVGRRTTAVALVLGALLNAAAAYTNTAFLGAAPTAQGYIEALTARPALGLVGVGLNLLGIPLMLIGIAGLLQFASAKAPIVSRVTLAATVIGMLAFLCMNGALMALYTLGASGNADAAAEQLVGTSPGMAAMLVPFLVGNAVGMICLAIALLRSRVVALWVPIVLLAFFVTDFLLPGVAFFEPHLLFVVFALASARAVLRSSRQPYDSVLV